MAIVLVTKIEQALGNGTRPAGFVFGTFQGDALDAGELAASVWHSPEAVESIVPSEGVIKGELISACNSVGTSCAVIDQDAVPPPPKIHEPPAETDLASIAVDSLDLAEGVRKALIDAVGSTVADLQAFADANNGFTSIPGIGPEKETSIMEAIKAKLS